MQLQNQRTPIRDQLKAARVGLVSVHVKVAVHNLIRLGSQGAKTQNPKLCEESFHFFDMAK
jgi:hypothetical protein